MNRAKNIKHIFYFFLGISIFISGEVIGSERDIKRLEITGNCTSCSLINADLSGADLSRADLSGADLSNADLSKADLSRAVLSRADLSGAVLSRADLSNADLSKADLSRADLSEAAYMKGINLDGAILCETKLPWGIDNSGCPN